VSFPHAVRGYDRNAVDAYVKRVNRVIAELKVSASPPAAVRHALDQAGAQVQGLLQAARETADEIITSGRQEADESTARAKAEAAELIVNTSAEADRVKAEAEQVMADAQTKADDTVAKAKAEAEQIIATATAEAEQLRARSHAEADELHRKTQEEVAALQNRAETRMREIQADTEHAWKERTDLLDDIRGMANTLVELAGAAANRFPTAGPTESEEETATAQEENTPTQALPVVEAFDAERDAARETKPAAPGAES
jgi:cell division septum initiation protein DivIVA